MIKTCSGGDKIYSAALASGSALASSTAVTTATSKTATSTGGGVINTGTGTGTGTETSSSGKSGAVTMRGINGGIRVGFFGVLFLALVL